MAKETDSERLTRTARTLGGYPTPPEPPTGSEAVAVVKRTGRRGMRKDPGIVLVSSEERALIARFLRLIRSNYWLSHFVKNLLRLDSASPTLVSIESVQEQLGYAEELEDLIGRVQHIGKAGWWRDHPAINAIVEEWDDVFEYRGDRAICQLIESAKKEHVK